MIELVAAGLSAGLVLAATAAIAILDARRAMVEPPAVLALMAAAAAWRWAGPGEAGWAPWAGLAMGVGAVAVPIAAAHLLGRRWPLYPGDAAMLGAFGFLLGPLGLAWAMAIGSACSLAYRVWLQRRRGRPVRKGLAPLGPGMALGAAAAFVWLECGAAFAMDAGSAARAPVAVAPLAATELAPAGNAPPEDIGGRAVSFETDGEIPFALAVRRLSSAAGVAAEIEERPSRIAGGTAILPDPPLVSLSWDGALSGLLDRLAALGGYSWNWRDGAVVFHRYWDVEQRAASAAAGGADSGARWIVGARGGQTLRGVLDEWSRQAGWTLVWTAAADYAVESGPARSAPAVFRGGFLEAVDLLLAGDMTRRTLTALAYPANRRLVIGDAGGIGR